MGGFKLIDMKGFLIMVNDQQTQWDATYDVVVLGFGGAGATAARFAADKGQPFS